MRAPGTSAEGRTRAFKRKAEMPESGQKLAVELVLCGQERGHIPRVQKKIGECR